MENTNWDIETLNEASKTMGKLRRSASFDSMAVYEKLLHAEKHIDDQIRLALAE